MTSLNNYFFIDWPSLIADIITTRKKHKNLNEKKLNIKEFINDLLSYRLTADGYKRFG